MINPGISDLTTTEGNLKNYSRICNLFQKEVIDRDDLIYKIKNDKNINRTNKKVIERHLSILEHLNIIKNDLELFSLDYNGKILYEIIKNIDLSENNLVQEEKLFYFNTLFTEVTFPQLFILIYALFNNKGESTFDKILSYYETILESKLNIWNVSTLSRRLFLAKNINKLHRAEINRYNCMKYWLQSLNIIDKNELTTLGNKLINFYNITNVINTSWSQMINQSYNNSCYLFTYFYEDTKFNHMNYNNDKHRKLFLHYLKESYRLYGNKQMNLINTYFIENWPCYKLIENNKLYIIKEEISEIIRELYNEKIILAILPGDYGEKKLIKIAADKI